MTTDSTPISRAKTLAVLLPILAIVLTGFYSNKYYGTDGIVGVLLGIYMVFFTLIIVSKWNQEELSLSRSIIYKLRVPIIVAGLAGIVLGILDIIGIL